MLENIALSKPPSQLGNLLPHLSHFLPDLLISQRVPILPLLLLLILIQLLFLILILLLLLLLILLLLLVHLLWVLDLQGMESQLQNL